MPVMGRMTILDGSLSTAAARAWQLSTSRPRQMPFESGSENGTLSACMAHTTLPRARMASRVGDPAAWAVLLSEQSRATQAGRIVRSRCDGMAFPFPVEAADPGNRPTNSLLSDDDNLDFDINLDHYSQQEFEMLQHRILHE